MTEVVRRLADCSDAVAVAAELRAALPDLANAQDVPAVVSDVVAFLTTEGERWTAATQTLISEISEDSPPSDVHLELLDALLLWATQKTVEVNHEILEILQQYFEVATGRLGDGGDVRRWIKWGDQVLTLVLKNAAPMDLEVEDHTGRRRNYVVELAVLLLQLRNKVEGGDDATPDLKTATFVWKNLAKLATTFGPTLAGAASAAAVSVESIGQLLRALDAQNNGAPDLKFLKLYWRAFQRLTAAFASRLECELENCILAVVNVASSLIYAVRHSQAPATSKAGQELRAMLNQAMDITDNLVGNADGALTDQGQRQPSDAANIDTENSIRWGHLLVLTTFAGATGNGSLSSTDVEIPYDDGNRAVEVSQLFARYRECALGDSISRSIEGTELFTDAILGYFLSFESVVEMQLSLLKQTLYPDWVQRTLCWEVWRELLCFCWDEALAMQALQMLLDVTQWEDDSDKALVLSDGVEKEILQLVAFVYPDMPVALKDVCMDQVTAVIDVISSEGPGHQFNLRVASQLHLLEKLAGVRFLKEYDGPMKDEWIAKYLPMCFECCGTVLELLAAEGKVASAKRENILGMLRVLDMCLLLLRGVFDDNEPRQDDIAELSIILVRMSTEALSQLAQQSKQVGGSQSVGNIQPASKCSSSVVKLEQAKSRCIGRAVETSLYLLSKLGAVLKSNKNNQCVQVMKDLLAIIDNSAQFGGIRDTLLITARFVGTSLFDMQVAEGDMAVVWQLLLALFQKLFGATRNPHHPNTRLNLLLSVCLDALYELLAHSNIADLPGAPLKALLAGDLKQAFRETALLRKLSPEQVANALETAQASTLQALQRARSASYRIFRDRFPDEPAGLYAETEESSEDASAASNKRPADDSKSLPQKRHKLTHFVALCREIESSLSSIENDETAANILSGTELEDATAVLHRLLAKTITLCP
ncbi:hypothetical protein PF005_g5775 [Phytophthora fragariae]|uniref:Uncharacterized protein n=1 Tax=Phytophthora fragariae TaxID=53985 RepID=A0A6A3SZB0_9STRA|nr:hypothetical protein PF009_g5345 [Phytophthora fragariae]KAE9025680.1 hypothetical protein PF011_g2915 [Phytophthora fragariae]KAE9126638.1 hypothetical protein PF007_g5891 [Phytophthora fragariae]KAE9150856.1 hypothetical protein PF006_g4797 [Phytophthora fragariae]KAE9224796.1 hypothetical protein PF005_g5775 [Phytophthora fragariae]